MSAWAAARTGAHASLQGVLKGCTRAAGTCASLHACMWVSVNPWLCTHRVTLTKPTLNSSTHPRRPVNRRDEENLPGWIKDAMTVLLAVDASFKFFSSESAVVYHDPDRGQHV